MSISLELSPQICIVVLFLAIFLPNPCQVLSLLVVVLAFVYLSPVAWLLILPFQGGLCSYGLLSGLPFCPKDAVTTLSLAPQGALSTTVDTRRLTYEQALGESFDGTLLYVKAKKVERALVDSRFLFQSTATPLKSKDQFIDIVFSAAKDMRVFQNTLSELISEGNAIFLRTQTNALNNTDSTHSINLSGFWYKAEHALQMIARVERKLLLFQELMLAEELSNTESRDRLSLSIWSSLTKAATIQYHDQIAQFAIKVDYQRQQVMGRLDGILLSLQSLKADREFINSALKSPSHQYRSLQIWASFQKLSCFRREGNTYNLLIGGVVELFTAELKIMFFDSPKATNPPPRKVGSLNIPTSFAAGLMVFISYVNGFIAIIAASTIIPALVCAPAALEHLPDGVGHICSTFPLSFTVLRPYRNINDLVSNLTHRVVQLEEEVRGHHLRRNFAHLFDNAMLIPKITTLTEGMKENSWMYNPLPSYSIIGPAYLPIFTSDPRLAQVVDQCWQFKAKNGTLGIQLSQPTRITSIAIDNVHLDTVSFDRGSKAPRVMRVWGMLDNQLLLPTEVSGRQAVEFSTNKAVFNSKSLVQAEELFAILLEFKYDPRIAPTYKLFTVPNHHWSTGHYFRALVLEILDNWDTSVSQDDLEPIFIYTPLFSSSDDRRLNSSLILPFSRWKSLYHAICVNPIHS
ncbi:hypothetical protein NP233_g3801 [Leucocoprinus birnbaumii]|uniref:SUN domain-containing protein n=1 Tax=Leucocoprinus birnbaumii TaxID=56174 RepID=A0AAD5YY36_9AGAR|nr:hypothetical protein NP233_g3801 [Leucocoprinus birnbaumii]